MAVSKDSWGPGPWQAEPDKRQWTDPATGLVCLIVRSPVTGALCGYVGIPSGHRCHGADYEAIDVAVHGGLTYAAACTGDPEHGICHVPAPGEPDDLYWLGFDCAHAFDFSPRVDARLRDAGVKDADIQAINTGSVYRDIGYVRHECERLAAQLATI